MNAGSLIGEKPSFRSKRKTAGAQSAGQDMIDASKSEEQQAPRNRAKIMKAITVENERRWTFRRSIEVDAEVRNLDGHCYAVKVTEISEEGCSVSLVPGCNLEHDGLYAVNINGLPPLTAYVIWSSEGRAGLNLSKALSPSTVQSLTAKSLHERLVRVQASSVRSEDHLDDLPPFPFD